MLDNIAEEIRYVMLKPMQGQWTVTATFRDHTTASASGETVAKALKDLGKILTAHKEQE